MLEIVFVILLSVVRKCLAEKGTSQQGQEKSGSKLCGHLKASIACSQRDSKLRLSQECGDIFSKSCSKRQASRIHDIIELRLWGERADNIRPLSFVGTQKIWNIFFSCKNVKIKRKYTNAQNGLSRGMLHKQPLFTY